MVLAIMFCMNACDVEKEPYIQGAENEKMILKFEVISVIDPNNGTIGTVDGIIDEDSKKVMLDFPAGTIPIGIPNIMFSTYATIEPE